MSDTPRTDAQPWINQYPEYHASATRYVSADFARELERENAELDEKLESKRKTIKSLNEELEKLRIISIENERLAIENKHLREDRPQSELDAAHIAAENVMLNTTFARYISATQDTEKENERLASTVRGLEMELDRLERERTQWLCTCGGTKPNA